MAEDNSENKRPTKLDVDRPQDFKFHIAYEVYSRAWEDNASDSVRVELNELIIPSQVTRTTIQASTPR